MDAHVRNNVGAGTPQGRTSREWFQHLRHQGLGTDSLDDVFVPGSTETGAPRDSVVQSEPEPVQEAEVQSQPTPVQEAALESPVEEPPVEAPSGEPEAVQEQPQQWSSRDWLQRMREQNIGWDSLADVQTVPAPEVAEQASQTLETPAPEQPVETSAPQPVAEELGPPAEKPEEVETDAPQPIAQELEPPAEKPEEVQTAASQPATEDIRPPAEEAEAVESPLPQTTPEAPSPETTQTHTPDEVPSQQTLEPQTLESQTSEPEQAVQSGETPNPEPRTSREWFAHLRENGLGWDSLNDVQTIPAPPPPPEQVVEQEPAVGFDPRPTNPQPDEDPFAIFNETAPPAEALPEFARFEQRPSRPWSLETDPLFDLPAEPVAPPRPPVDTSDPFAVWEASLPAGPVQEIGYGAPPPAWEPASGPIPMEDPRMMDRSASFVPNYPVWSTYPTWMWMDACMTSAMAVPMMTGFWLW